MLLLQLSISFMGKQSMHYGDYIGIMSGTSLDGIDVVLATISADGIYEKGGYTHPLPVDVKQAILALCQGQPTTLSQLGQLDTRLGQLFAQAVNQLLKQQHYLPQQIKAIGNHGQTVWHEPSSAYPNTLQIADNNQIAALTGITTVGDFRRRDMVYGGQGAPLVPAFHQALLSSGQEKRIIVNIGGIANITTLYPQQSVIGFDTGPGNMLMDAWISQQRQLAYDQDGQWALTGNIHQPLLQQMLQDNYFDRQPPKSTGREYFNLAWLQQHLADFPTIAAADVQATLLELTAITISQAITQQPACQRVLLCGGGAHNRALRQRITQLLAPVIVGTTDDLGISVDNLEALAFAWLAYRTLSGQPGNLPAVTGACQATILGAVYAIN